MDEKERLDFYKKVQAATGQTPPATISKYEYVKIEWAPAPKGLRVRWFGANAKYQAIDPAERKPILPFDLSLYGWHEVTN